MTQLNATLSRRSIRSLRQQLDKYRRTFDMKLENLLYRLSEMGLRIAVAAVPSYTGSLRSSISVKRIDGKEYLIVADSEQAAFIEFGTGVVGEGTYNYELPEVWEYDERRSPWAHDPKDPTRWWYFDEQGRRRSTRGSVAKPFMGMAAEVMRMRVLETAKEVFG